MIGKQEIENRFGYHKGSAETMPKHAKVRQEFIAMANFIDQTIPDGRAKSCAMTALQEAGMWTNFGVAEQAPLVGE